MPLPGDDQRKNRGAVAAGAVCSQRKANKACRDERECKGSMLAQRVGPSPGALPISFPPREVLWSATLLDFPPPEINSTFHRSHRPQTMVRWATAVRDQFRFAVKLPKVITHDLRLVGTAHLLEIFLEETRDLGSKTGPFLLQLPPSLAYDHSIARTFFELLRTYT